MINLSQQCCGALWSDVPSSDNQTLIETLVEVEVVVVVVVVDIVVGHSDDTNHRQTMGRLVAVADRAGAGALRQPTTIILAGSVLLPVWPGQAATGQVAFSDIL